MKAKLMPSGNWNVKALDYIDERGKKHIRSFTAPTKEQAELLGAQFKSPICTSQMAQQSHFFIPRVEFKSERPKNGLSTSLLSQENSTKKAPF